MKDTHQHLSTQGKVRRSTLLRLKAQDALKDRKLARSAALYRESRQLKDEAEAELKARQPRSKGEVLEAGAQASSLVFG